MAKGILPPSVKAGKPILGSCPAGWKSCTYGDLFKIVERPVKLLDEEEYQLVTVKRSRGGVVPRERLTGRQIKTKSAFEIKKGDFLISNRQIVHGACALVPQDMSGAIVSGEYTVLNAVNGSSLEYLQHFSNSLYFQQSCYHSSIGVDIEKMVFKLDRWMKTPVHFPNPAEQRKIAEILSCWDDAVSKYSSLYALKEREKKIILARIFQTNMGQQTRIGEFISIKSKKYDPRNSSSDAICIELEHIDQGTGNLIGTTSAKSLGSIKNVFKPGDVLFGKLRPYLRKYLLPSFQGVCSSEIWVLHPDPNKCIPSFLFYLVQTEQFIQASNRTCGTKMPRADWDLIAESSVTLPSLEYQHKFSTALIQLDAEISVYRKFVNALMQQKQALMQKLLTGKIRVRV